MVFAFQRTDNMNSKKGTLRAKTLKITSLVDIIFIDTCA